MRQMKDSGIEWIDKIPHDWTISNIKSRFAFGKGLPITKENLVSKGLPVISYGQIHSKSNTGTKVTSDLIRYVNENEWISYQNAIATRGNFIFADTSEDYAGCGNCAYIDKDEKIFAGYHTILLKSLDNENKYYAYLFLTDGWRNQVREKCAGVKLFSITQRNLKSAIIINPPFDEQQKIAAFLDEKCTEIDNAISKTTASIEEYKKLKQSIITKAVTKGIRGNRPMKDSGIEWIGEIPTDWKTLRGKMLFYETNNRSDDGDEELLTVSHITGITPRSVKNVNMFMSESLVDYKICEVGDIAANTMWLWQGAIGVSRYRGVISPSYNTYRQRSSFFDLTYLDYMLRIGPLVNVYKTYSTGIVASRLRLYPKDFLSIHFPVPPMQEQVELGGYLNFKCQEIDKIIGRKQQLISELEAYKKSLIYEYVTGKKEVR